MPGPSPTLLPTALTRVSAAIVLGAREWLLLALLAFALFGRSAATGPGRIVARWLGRPRRAGRRSPGGLDWVAEHWAGVMMTLAALALVAWTIFAWSVARPRSGG